MKHLTDPELLLASEGELPEARQHLLSCAECQARLQRMETALRRFQVSQPPPRRWGTWAASAACLAAVAGGLWLARNPRIPAPDARLTPGATVAVTLAQVCSAPAGEETRVVPASVARQVFLKYGIHNPKPRAYEVDYLITPALGGSDDIDNLWPQPYSESIWNAHVKDALEDHLRRQVCAGTLALAVAQRELSTDWVAAYKRHFATNRPLAQHARFLKDRPWE